MFSDERAYRLPRTVLPRRYELTLTPDLKAFTFDGRESVDVSITESVDEIVLNADDLEIRSARLVGTDGAERVGAISYDADNERAIIHLDATAEAGSWRLELEFRGILNDKLAGFYRSTYRDETGQQQIIAATQFESTDARKAFPCWDEPDFKARFKVTLVVAPELTAISNSRVVSETPIDSGKKAVSFAETVKMSTYLLAFIVGSFEATEPRIVNGTPLRVLCVPGKLRLAPFALEAGAFSLAFHADYYGIPYPGDKLDMIAIPDFAAGAMENLGAVTYRENALLVDEKTASRLELERVADVVAHELAHMWFGDLVTMRWWNGIWLNEAFATFMELVVVDAWKPAWERWISFGVSRAAALHVDGLHSTRSIEYPVGPPDEAAGMFDILTYQKGGAVLRMLEQYLGPEVFRRGISGYLEEHKYDNAETTDLWDAIESVSEQPVRRVMDSWIFQAGFPLVSVELANGNQLTLSQRQFRYLDEGAPADGLWRVPVMLRGNGPNGTLYQKVLLESPEQTVQLPQKVVWVVANEGGHGFYRVRYSSDLLRRLTANFQQDLAAIERFGLVSDTWASLLAGLTPLADFLDLARLFQDETDHNVWSALLGALGYLNRALEPAQRPALQEYVRQLVAPAVERLGWSPLEGENELIGQLRGGLVGALGTLGEDAPTQARAHELFGRYREDRSAVDRNLLPAVVGIVAHTGGQAEYQEFVQRYRSAPTPQEEQRFLMSLAGFQDRDLLRRTVEKTLTDEVRTQNGPHLVGALMHNLVGGDLAWEFTKRNWDKLLARFPEHSIIRMSEGITALNTPSLEADVRAFFAEHKVPAAGKTLDQHLERLHIAVVFKQREAESLAKEFPAM